MADLARIKRNVAKMAAQNAPEEDIDGYIASEGVTLDDVRNFKFGQPESQVEQPKPAAEKGWSDMTLGDVAGAVGTGLQNAVDTALPYYNEIGSGIDAGIDYAQGKGDYGDLYAKRLKENNQTMATNNEEHPVAAVTGSVAGALALPAAGEVAISKMGLSGIPALAARMGGGAAEGALYGSGANDDDRATGGLVGAGIGAVTGGIGHGLISKFGSKVDDAAIPAIEDIKQASEDAYSAALKNGRGTTAAETNAMGDDVKKLINDRFTIGNTRADVPQGLKDAERILDSNRDMPLSSDDVHKLFKHVKDYISPTMAPGEKAALTDTYKTINKTLQTTTPGIDEANKLYRDYKTADKAQTALDAARRSTADGTSKNMNAAIRKEFLKLRKELEKKNSPVSDQISKQIDSLIKNNTFRESAQNTADLLDPISTGPGLINQLKQLGSLSLATGTGGSSLPLQLGGAMAAKAFKAGVGVNKEAKADELIKLLRAGGIELPRKKTAIAPLLKALEKSAPRLAANNPYVVAISDRDEK